MTTRKKKIKFLDMKLTNHSVDEAERKVLQLFKSVRALGEQKIDVKIDFFTKEKTEGEER